MLYINSGLSKIRSLNHIKCYFMHRMFSLIGIVNTIIHYAIIIYQFWIVPFVDKFWPPYLKIGILVRFFNPFRMKESILYRVHLLLSNIYSKLVYERDINFKTINRGISDIMRCYHKPEIHVGQYYNCCKTSWHRIKLL